VIVTNSSLRSEWLGRQAIKAKANKGLNPSQAKRRREELARLPEFLLSVAYFILIPGVLLGPCVVIWVTNADPLQAAPLTFGVCTPPACRPHSQGHAYLTCHKRYRLVQCLSNLALQKAAPTKCVQQVTAACRRSSSA
jgi:hypothetical protein